MASWMQKELGKEAALIYYTSKLENNVYALENDLPAEPKTGEPVEDEITDESVELPEEEPEQGTAEAEASSKTDSEKKMRRIKNRRSNHFRAWNSLRQSRSSQSRRQKIHTKQKKKHCF